MKYKYMIELELGAHVISAHDLIHAIYMYNSLLLPLLFVWLTEPSEPPALPSTSSEHHFATSP